MLRSEFWRLLEAGEKLTAGTSSSGYICLDGLGNLVDDEGDPCALDAHEMIDCGWHIYKEPKRDIMWAIEQHRAGKQVAREGRSVGWGRVFDADDWFIAK